MSYITSSEEWQRQSALLLQARPATTRITTKYHIPSPTTSTSTSSTSSSQRRAAKLAARKATTTATTPDASAEPTPETTLPKQPLATLILKTYDPESGVCLKYRTNKSAEVGRLIAGLGRLGRTMAGLKETTTAESAMEGLEGAAAAVGSVVEGVKEAVGGVVEGGKGLLSGTPVQQQQQAKKGKKKGRK